MEAAETARWSAQALPGCVAGLRQAVVEFANGKGVPDPPLADVSLAVSEAVSNAVRHGYGHGTPAGPVEVAAEWRSRELRVIVSDDGVGFASASDDPGSGFGLRLMDELTDRMEIREHHPRGTEVHLSFDLPLDDLPRPRALS